MTRLFFQNFPLREWLAVFPTVLGASHSNDLEFWRPYTEATEGLRNFAQSGYTVDLELELKKKVVIEKKIKKKNQ